MSRFHSVLTVFFTFSVTAAYSDAQDTIESKLKENASQFVVRLNGGEYEAAVMDFDAKMTSVMPPEKLREAWQSLQPEAGSFEAILGVVVVKKGEFEIAVVTCEFAKGQLDVKIVYDSEGKISGLWFSPTPPHPAPPPSYADTKLFTEHEVTIGSGMWALPGTLAMPIGKGPFPAVALVHGSGPNDRDETIGPNKPFRDLAWGLASRGIGVLRYEKRTKQHGLKMVLLANELTVKEETIDDALAAITTLRAEARIDAKRIYMLGHSLGGMLVPRIAKRDEEVAGFVVFAGTSRPLEDVLLQQTKYVLSLEEGLSEKDRVAIEKLAGQVSLVKSEELTRETPSSELPLGVPAAYWLDLRGYEPAKEAADLKRRLLVMQAGRDYQVTMDDYQIWRQALDGRSDTEFRLYPKCNHLFIEGEGPCTPAEYSKPGHVAEAVIEDIANWIHRHH